MFWVHTPIIRSIRFWFNLLDFWVVAYSFLHRVFGWVVLLRAIAWVVCAVRMVPCTLHTVHMTYAAALKTNTHPKTRCRKPYATTQYLMLLTVGVITRNMSSIEYINKITLLHQVGISIYFIISIYFMRKMHRQTTLKFTKYSLLKCDAM